MSAGVQASVGQTLRAAREAQGISVEDAAARLRLMQRQVEAMEADDFDSLGPVVFARGFVRNYARMLALAPEPLMADMQGAVAEPATLSHAAPVQPHSWLSSPWLILLLVGLLVLVVVPVALYWWLNSEGGAEPGEPASAATQPARPAPVAPAPAAPEAAGSVAAPAPADVPAESDAAATVNEPAPEAPANRGVLHLEFGDEAWVEIKDATGRMLHRQLNPAGSRTDLSGEPPFDLVIGNASQARVTYNGRPIDLTPFIAGSVARFTLEE